MQVFLKQVREFLRAPAAVFNCVIMPAMLVLMLGTFLQQLDYSDYEIGDISIHYSTEDADMFNAMAFEQFITRADMISAEKSLDPDLSRKMTEKGEISAFVTLNGSDIEIYAGANGVINRALNAVFNSYQQVSAMYVSIAKEDPAALSVIDFTAGEDDFVKHEGLGATRSMIDYYAVAILVMMLFFSIAISSGDAIHTEQSQNTLVRTLVTPKRRVSVLISMMLGKLIEAVIIIFSTMVFSVLLCGASYCDNIWGNLLLILMYFSVSLALTAVGFFIGLLIKVPAPAVILPISWSMLFFSGSFSKPTIIEGFSEYLPPYIIQQASFSLTLFGDSSGAIMVTVVCFAVSAVCVMLATLIFSKKKYV